MGYNSFELLPHLSCIVEVLQQLLGLPVQDLQEVEVSSVVLLKSSSLLEIGCANLLRTAAAATFLDDFS